MTKTQPLLQVLATAAAVALLSGCGGSDSSSTEPAAVSPPATPVFIEGNLQPKGSLKQNVEALAAKVAGIDDLGATIVAELESSAAASDQTFDFETEVKPWLGQRAAIFLTEFNGDDFEG